MLARRYLDRPIVWEAALDVVPLSTSANASTLRAALTAMGLTLTRASSATVQTAASALVITGIGVDDPRVGDGGYGRGLVLEETRTNSCDLSSPWTWGATGVAKSQVLGPDGVAASATRIEDTDPAGFGFVSRSIAYTAATPYIASCWINAEQSTPAGEVLSFNTNDGAVLNPIARSSVLGAWSRKGNAAYVSGAGPTSNFSIVPVYSTVAGLGAASFYGLQRENGRFVTELIPTAGAAATRSPERLQASSTLGLVRDGVLSIEIDFTPKAASRAGFSFYPVFAARDVNNYVAFDYIAGGVTCAVAGVGVSTAPAALDWTGGERVRLFARVGMGASVVWTKVGNAAAVQRTDARIMGAFPTGPIDIMNVNGGQQFSSWIHRVRAWAPGRRPAWAV